MRNSEITRRYFSSSSSPGIDLQMVEMSLRVLFRPDPHQLPFIYRRLGYGATLTPHSISFSLLDFDERVLPSIVNEVSKAVVARFNASELLTRREDVSRQIREMLTKRADDFHILLEDVSITHLAFSKDYTAAVEVRVFGNILNSITLPFVRPNKLLNKMQREQDTSLTKLFKKRNLL